MKKSVKRLLSLLFIVVLSTTITAITTQVKAATLVPDVQYQAHVQNIGWQASSSYEK